MRLQRVFFRLLLVALGIAWGLAAPADSRAQVAADTARAAAPADTARAAAPADSARAAAPADTASAAIADSTESAPPDSTSGLIPAPPDSTLATLHVETKPESLQVFVDGVSKGRSPLAIQREPGTVRVRALPADPRRSDLPWPIADAKLRSGETTFVFLDLRAPVFLSSDPEPAQVTLIARAAAWPDSQLGETPLRLLPPLLESGAVRLSRSGYADTTLAGSVLAGAPGPVRVTLKPIGGVPVSSTKGTSIPIYRKSWFGWTLVGIGAALSAAAIVFHHEADDWYDRYLASSDVHEIPTLYDQTVHYDHLAAVSLGVGQGSLLTGILLLIVGEPR